MFRALMILFLVVVALSAAIADDPLRQALEQLQREAAELRRELESPLKTDAASMQTPAMSGRPTVASPQPTETVVFAPAPEKCDHWSFQPVVKPPVPPSSSGNEIDAFVEARLVAAGVQTAPAADAATLCRRVYFDLTGLPPTAEEALEFVSKFSSSPRLQVSPSAANDLETGRLGDGEKGYEALVDRLLASPRFGERWARHWLDVVRYADSVGRSWNAPFTYAWRYRDYVIDSLNADVPYDRFIAEQLAGDLLKSDDVDERRAQLTGLGFLGLGSLDLRGGDGSFKLDQIDDQIDVTTRAFLGITVACARCHDHKYDPVTMRDYYALAGIFESTDVLQGQADRSLLGGNGYVDPDRLTQLPSPGGATSADDYARGGGIHSMSDYQRAWSTNRNVRFTTDPNLAMSAREGETADCELRLRGEPYDLGPAVPRGDVRIPSLPRLPPIPPGVSGRLELARWIGSRDNPLTARVAVNRVWQHLFGRGLVRTVDDFGTTGEAPTHPELLDWLAASFIEGRGERGEGREQTSESHPSPLSAHPWSLKKLIRTIVLSQAYRRSSSAVAASAAIDPDNGLYWRQNLRALELEPLRDAMLCVSGRLETERPYGIQVTGIGGKQGNRSLLGFDAPYRTIYLPVMRAHVPDVYGVFDFPDPTQIQGRRESTTVAPQALFFMNDRFAVDCARSTAEQLLSEPGLDDAGRIGSAYLRLFGRRPSPEEAAIAGSLLAELRGDAEVRDPDRYRWAALVQALMSSAEFRFVR